MHRGRRRGPFLARLPVARLVHRRASPVGVGIVWLRGFVVILLGLVFIRFGQKRHASLGRAQLAWPVDAARAHKRRLHPGGGDHDAGQTSPATQPIVSEAMAALRQVQLTAPRDVARLRRLPHPRRRVTGARRKPGFILTGRSCPGGLDFWEETDSAKLDNAHRL